MDANRPVTEERLQLILSRLGFAEDWENLFSPAPAAPAVPTPIPPVIVTGEQPLNEQEIAQLRQWIGSSGTGPLRPDEVDAVHALLAKGKGQ